MNFVLPSAITLGSLALIAACAFLILKAVKGGASPQLTFHYLVSGGIVFLYFAALVPWVYWIMFHGLPQPGEAVKFDNGVLEFLMRRSQNIGIIEHLVALGVLGWQGWKGNLKVALTLKVLAAAVVVMVFFAAVLPWLLWLIDVFPQPPAN